MDLKSYIRTVDGFPTAGIRFKDLSLLLATPNAFHYCLKALVKLSADYHFNTIGAIDARGFLFGAPLAYELGLPLVMFRKQGKLPPKTIQTSYQLEYNSGVMEVQDHLLSDHSRVLLVDDVLATGGTLLAASRLITKAKATLALCLCVIELTALLGRNNLQQLPVKTLLQL